MKVCACCTKVVYDQGKLCKDCDLDRLAAASAARIASGRGLNFENAEEFSEKNWIKARGSKRSK
jgi:hypothetical protein